MKFILVLVAAIAVSYSSVRAQSALAWHHPEAALRTVYLIEAPLAMRDPSVTLPAPAQSGNLALVSADLPHAPLPVHRDTNGLSFVLPGTLAPGKPRIVIVYQGGKACSPKLEEAPRLLCDYAANEIGYSWDFENGTQCGIATWGDRPHHFGAITVNKGWLQIPVKGPDPYFIFGNMFGNAPTPRDLHINSGLYRTLELRIRQSCPAAQWAFFVTDSDGRCKSLNFEVRGTEAQTFRFDLKAAFPDFWDGREFRAIRIDTTNDKRDVLAEVDYVRILPAPPSVIAGPSFTRETVAARDAIAKITPAFPKRVTAGAPCQLTVKTYGSDGDRLDAAPAIWALITEEFGTTFIESGSAGKTATLALPVFRQAGRHTWTLGLAGDFGQPLHTVSNQFDVEPAALAAYRLTPAQTFIPLQAPRVQVSVQGLDAFGNTLPVSIKKPRWTLAPGLQVPDSRLRGNPASVAVTCPNGAPATHAITLADDQGHRGTVSVTTVNYRKDTIRLNANGYLVTPAGTLFFPNGGLYANWPHKLNADGNITRSVDLFPCGPAPYKEGFPWSAATEAALDAYLKHCSERGVNCLRLMLRNMDLVGRVDPVQLQATLHLFDLARPYNIRFHVALFEDYDKPPYVSPAILEKIVLPQYTPEQLAGLPPHRARFLIRKATLPSPALRYSDPDAMACQCDYLRELIPVLASREEVLCYEFENEMVFPPMSWCAATAAFIRTIDPHTLIVGNPGPHDWPEPLRWRESGCDLYNYHPYNDGLAQADHGAIVYLRSKWSAQSGLPMYTGEGGLNQNRWQNDVKKVGAESAARGTRDQIWMSVCCGANGCLYWTFMNDLEAQEYAKVQPAFAALGIDLPALRRQRPSVALLHPLKQRDTRDAAMAMRLLDLGVDFDTVATNEAGAYAVRIDMAAQTPDGVTLPATVAAPAKGWQIATLLAEKNDQALLYLRNTAGGVKDVGAPPRPCFLRDVQPAEAAFTLRQGWTRIVAYDLDARQARAVTADAAGRVSLGTTSHDFLIGLHK
ncbi:MAG TPA: hypothetical protein PKM57_08985 [Kiritimatiellia bacterium]|nr:hypothetical protein [Kiritimatiellia bacterium]HPS06221.1 hypothetical protein [Kiritimatiellia bacterium]